MAVARAQVAGGGMNGVKIALIVFVVLTVASLTYTIVMLTQQSELQAQATQASSSAQSASATAQQARGQLANMAHRVLGESIDDPARVEESLQRATEPYLKDERISREVPQDASVMTLVQGLHKLYTSTSEQLAKLTAERDELSKQVAAMTQSSAEREKKFQEAAEQLQKQYQALEQQVASNRDSWNQQVEDLKRRLEAAGTTAAQQLGSERQARQKLEEQLAELDRRRKELVGTLASYRPSTEQLAALQVADGRIVRAVAGDNLVYISLGARDQVKPGLTFSVYSRSGNIPETGEGKATIEVTKVFDTTSEARVTGTKPGDPIIEGDVIANPVYDRRRQFNFAVAGDFDLNFDGVIDDPGGQQVRQLIERWGGKVVDRVDTRTDFVVLGDPPPDAPKAGATDDDAARQRAAELERAHSGFEAVMREAQALSIPILTRTQFLHFMGTTVPRRVGGSGGRPSM